MPNGAGAWMATNPPFHTELVQKADTAKRGRLKALIKLMQAWNIANGHHLSSYHVELLVEAMKRDYPVGDWSTEIAAILKAMAPWTRSSFADPWKDGVRVDLYLPSDARARVIRMLESDAKAAEAAEEYQLAGRIESAFDRWDVVHRDAFPAFG